MWFSIETGAHGGEDSEKFADEFIPLQNLSFFRQKIMIRLISMKISYLTAPNIRTNNERFLWSIYILIYGLKTHWKIFNSNFLFSLQVSKIDDFGFLFPFYQIARKQHISNPKKFSVSFDAVSVGCFFHPLWNLHPNRFDVWKLFYLFLFYPISVIYKKTSEGK